MKWEKPKRNVTSLNDEMTRQWLYQYRLSAVCQPLSVVFRIVAGSNLEEVK
jgi:hypothetical protein